MNTNMSNSRFNSNSSALEKIWTSQDLCLPCRHVDLYNSDNRKRLIMLHIQPKSGCPLCHFFYNSWTDEIPGSGPVCIPMIAHREAAGSLGGAFWMLGSADLDRVIMPLNLNKSDAIDAPQVRMIDESAISFETIKHWLSCCQSKHRQTCYPRTTAGRKLANLRLIDCSTRTIVSAPKSCEFVVLSYVWGAYTPPKDEKDRDPAALPTFLPKTIKDAITVTVRCGHRYLWVDQFCIDQKDPADKQRQIMQMDLVYMNAVFTIVAAAGQDSSYGLPGISIARKKQPCINIDGQIWTSTLPRWDMHIGASKWNTRAWTYQEAICSPRRLFFTEDQIVFECNIIGCSEALELDWDKHCLSTFNLTLFKGQHPNANDDKVDAEFQQQKRYDTITRYLQMYSERDMSFQSDALNAMKGIYQMLENEWQIYQHWGMPLMDGKDFAEGLIWRTTFSRWSSKVKRRAGFPSWSWCGWISPISWYTSSSAEVDSDPPRTLGFIPQYRVQESHDGVLTSEDSPILDKSSCLAANVLATSTLLVTADVVLVRFKPRNLSVALPHRFVVDVPSDNPLHRQHLWDFDLTPDLTGFEDLRTALLNETFEIVLIHRFHGLIVRTVDHVKERIGLLNLCAVYQKGLEHDRPFLNDILPCETRTVALG